MKPLRLPVRDHRLIRVVDYMASSCTLYEYGAPVSVEDKRQMLWCELLHKWPLYEDRGHTVVLWAQYVCRTAIYHHHAWYSRVKRGGGVSTSRLTKKGGHLSEFLWTYPLAPESKEARVMDQHRFSRALTRMPEEQAALLRERVSRGVSVYEAARQRGISRIALRKMECEAMRLLEQHLVR